MTERMKRKIRRGGVFSVLTVTPFLIAATVESDVRSLAYIFAAVLLSVAGVMMKRHYDSLNTVLEATPKIQSALYGIDQGDGKRYGGVLGRVTRIEEDVIKIRDSVAGIPALAENVERALVEVHRLAEEARQLQREIRHRSADADDN